MVCEWCCKNKLIEHVLNKEPVVVCEWFCKNKVIEHVLNMELVEVCEWFSNSKIILNPENVRRWFSRENLMSSYHYFLKELHYHQLIQ